MSDSSESPKTANSQHEENITLRRAQRVRRSTEREFKQARMPRIKVPTFSPDEPDLWFALLEGQFEANGVNDDYIKFTLVANNLDMHYAKEIKDIIVNPPPRFRYEKIKAELMKRLSASNEKKVQQLVMHEVLGDRKPSQFLRHLQDLAGPECPEHIIKTIWSNRLPRDLQRVLASQSTQSLQQLAELADRIEELTSSGSIATTSAVLPQRLDTRRDEIAELKNMIIQLSLKLEEHTRSSCASCSTNRPERSHDRHRSPSRERRRSRSRTGQYAICWYHSKFGDDAKKCIKPCKYPKAENSVGSR